MVFPQQINLAATFNPELAREAGRVAARDSRAAAVPWLFAPILGLATQPLWPRVFETFGEDPFLTSRMGEALVKGIQASQEWGSGDSDDGEPLRAAACMKHFLGYSHPTSGHDRSPSRIPEQELLEMYLPPFQVDSLNFGGADGTWHMVLLIRCGSGTRRFLQLAITPHACYYCFWGAFGTRTLAFPHS